MCYTRTDCRLFFLLPRFFPCKACASCKLAAPFGLWELHLHFVNNSIRTQLHKQQQQPFHNPHASSIYRQIRRLSPTDFHSPLSSCCILCPVSHLIGTPQRPPWTGHPSLARECCFSFFSRAMRR
jgi:hypothetical protein